MNTDIYNDIPDILIDFLQYHFSVRGHSEKTIYGYYYDLKILFKYLKQIRKEVDKSVPFENIDISDVNIDFVKKITLDELYRYQSFSPVFMGTNYSLSPASRCRRTSAVKSFFNYITSKKHYLDSNITLALDMPKRSSSLPIYLEEDECEKLFKACDDKFGPRDYCIIMLFISCGLRVSELVSLNLPDVYEDHVRVTGKGNKERIVFFAEGCREALDDYLLVRDSTKAVGNDERALFLSQKNCRFTTRGIEQMIERKLLKAGLDTSRYSPHKLRHTAATLMMKNGVDTRVLQEVLGHSNLNTTQIYTHLDNSSLHEAAMANPIGCRKKDDNLK